MRTARPAGVPERAVLPRTQGYAVLRVAVALRVRVAALLVEVAAVAACRARRVAHAWRAAPLRSPAFGAIGRVYVPALIACRVAAAFAARTRCG